MRALAALLATTVLACSHDYRGLLPANARIVGIRRLSSAAHENRAMILWMTVDADSCPADWKELWTTMCPSSTRGCYFSGQAHVTLVDAGRREVINTIGIVSPGDRGHGEAVDIPHRLGRGGPYRVTPFTNRPRIMRLRDYNGDGDPSEFALFDALSCSDLLSTLVGYSRRRDRVLQYPVHLQWFTPGEPAGEAVTVYWVEQLYGHAASGGHAWQYTASYPPGIEEDYQIRFDPEEEAFVGTCHVRDVSGKTS